MRTVRVTPLPNGPVELEGPVEVISSDGEALEAPTTPVYLCRCGQSANKPFCDGSHARVGWTERSA
jgi:CDGSH-type Zn-finger protein